MRAALPDERRRAIRDSFARQGLLTAMGARILAIEPGRCVVEMPWGPGVSQQHGFFHGGAVGALADTAGGYAAMTATPAGADVLTLEYKINFLRPASGEALVAEGVVLRAGRSVVVTRVDVYARTGEERALCAAVQQSVVPAPARQDAS